MISICIPVYNYDVTELVKALTAQMELLNEDLELIIIDDGSKKEFKIKNQSCLKRHTYIELPNNIGRSKIRNLFKDYAKNQFLLFLDCDVEIVENNFLKKYIDNSLRYSFDVICGGLVYSCLVPKKTHLLRWKYGIDRECRSVEERNKYPYNSFMTSNFLVKKKILEAFPFDEKIEQYGHEDTLLGFDLKKASKEIIHIQNPVLHADKESNETFICKTENATQNLFYILNNQSHKNDLIESVKLLSYVMIIHKFKMFFLVNLIFKIIKKNIKSGLISGNITSLACFDFYKLGVFLEYERSVLKK